MSAIRLESDYDLAAVIEMYRRINTEGTPHSPEDLERALSVLSQGCSEVAQREPQDDDSTAVLLTSLRNEHTRDRDAHRHPTRQRAQAQL